MRKTTFYCDRCGKKIEGIVPQIGTRFLDSEGHEEDHEWGAELCHNCHKEIDDMVAFMVKNPSIHFNGGEMIKPKDPKKVAARKLELDLGKIGALYRSGRWSIKAIADEMHCSDQTIRNHLQEALDFYDKQAIKEDLEEALENDIQEETT